MLNKFRFWFMSIISRLKERDEMWRKQVEERERSGMKTLSLK